MWRILKGHKIQRALPGRDGTHLKKFLKMFPGLSLLPPGVVGVPGVVTELFNVYTTVVSSAG